MKRGIGWKKSDIREVDRWEVGIGKGRMYKMVVVLKVCGEVDYIIEMRKWHRINDKFVPTKKGFYISEQTLVSFLPVLFEVVDRIKQEKGITNESSGGV